MLENITNAACLGNAWDIKVYLPELRKKYPDFNASDLYIGDDTINCTGTITGDYVVFKKNFETCQTTKKVALSKYLNLLKKYSKIPMKHCNQNCRKIKHEHSLLNHIILMHYFTYTKLDVE